jgi:hypothetical protein
MDECATSSENEAEYDACLHELGLVDEGGFVGPLPEDVCYESDDMAEVEACITALGDPDALQEFRELACYDAEDDAAIEACLQGLGDPTAVAEFHEGACYDTDDDAEIEACLQGLVDKGELGPEILIEHRCNGVYIAVDDDGLEAADEAYDRCLADAYKEAGVPPPTTG